MMIEKYPYKKILALDWYQAAIGHLLFFRNLKQRMNNNVYFLFSQKGIMLKAATQQILKQSEEQVNKFFSTAKMQQLDLTYSSQFYQKLLEDIKGLTNKLKDNKDCPYINLIYSQKIKQSCLNLKKYGYSKPYQIWQQRERDKKGFCFLIVRPEYRWRQIANSVYNLVKKRQSTTYKPLNEAKMWTIEISYQKFIWFYKRKEFKQYKEYIELKENKNQNLLTIAISRQLSYLNQLEKQIDKLNYIIISQPAVNFAQLIQNTEIEIVSPLELQKITEIIYHQFGISNIVRRLRQINGYLIIGPLDIQNWKMKKEELFKFENIVDGLHKINPNQIKMIYKYGRKTQVVQYKTFRYISRRYQLPLKQNIKNCLKNRCPSLPKYYFYYQKDNFIYLLRSAYYRTFSFQMQNSSILQKIRLIYSLSKIIKFLHSINIFIGRSFKQSLYMQGQKIIVDCYDEGQKSTDIQQLKSVLKETKQYLDLKDETQSKLIWNLTKELQNKNKFDHDSVNLILERFQALLI